MKLLALLVIAVAVFCDPLRDALYGKTDWWTWHLVKWAAFYPPLAFIVLRELADSLWPCVKIPTLHRAGFKYILKHTWWRLAIITLAAWLLWLAGLYTAGWPWTPKSIQFIKEVLQ